MFKSRWIEGCNSKNGEIDVFADHFFIDFDGFSYHLFT